MTIRYSFIALTVCALLGCSSSGAEETSTPTSASPQPTQATAPKSETRPSVHQAQPGSMPTSPHGRAPAQRSTVVEGNRIMGEFIDRMDSRGYTYVAVETKPGTIVWAAGPQSTIQIGDSINTEKGHVMKGFTSPSLGKTFETIYFVTSLGTPRGADGQPTSRPQSAPTSRPSIAPTKRTTTPAPTTPISVEKVAGGQTIAEVFSQADALAGKNVQVRGQVVKFSGGIMGKNWIHLQDGTGDATKKTHDLTVTTDGKASVGDTIVIKGVLTRDKDFGAGYRYPVIIENATIEK